jgi:hypothetical protein
MPFGRSITEWFGGDWLGFNPGLLKDRVDIQQQGFVEQNGVVVQQWTSLFDRKLPAAIDVGDDPAASATQSGGHVQFEALHSILIRWTRTPILPGMRAIVVDNSYTPPVTHEYEIRGVNKLGRRNFMLVLHCQELNGPE